MTVDPLALLAEVDRATARLLATAATLDDAALAEPSALPGWTRGHVLTHVARNADAYTTLLHGAATGRDLPGYPSPTARAEGIEAGWRRPLAVQLDDLRAAAARFADAAAAMPADAWSMHLTHPGAAAATVPWARLREVEVHHVDLAAGYGPEDWSPAFSLRLLREVTAGLTAGPPLVLRPDGVDHPIAVGTAADGTAADATTVAGPVADLAAWLTGRGDGARLTATPGPLPTPPRWK